jgi:hypothetical protein
MNRVGRPCKGKLTAYHRQLGHTGGLQPAQGKLSPGSVVSMGPAAPDGEWEA